MIAHGKTGDLPECPQCHRGVQHRIFMKPDICVIDRAYFEHVDRAKHVVRELLGCPGRTCFDIKYPLSMQMNDQSLLPSMSPIEVRDWVEDILIVYNRRGTYVV